MWKLNLLMMYRAAASKIHVKNRAQFIVAVSEEIWETKTDEISSLSERFYQKLSRTISTDFSLEFLMNERKKYEIVERK